MLWCLRSPLSLHQAWFPDLLPQWRRSKKTLTPQGNALHNTDRRSGVGPCVPAHVGLLWVRRLACCGRPRRSLPWTGNRHPQPRAAAPTRAAEAASQRTPALLLPARAARLAPTHLAALSIWKAAAVAEPAHRALARRAARFPLLGSGSARAAPQPSLVLNSTPPGASGPRRAEGEEPETQAPSESP